MISTVPFDPSFADPVLDFWQSLHPDWTWLADPAARAQAFETRKQFERRGCVIRRGTAMIATVFDGCTLDPKMPRNRYIHIEVRPEDVAGDWLDPLLARLADLDRPHPGTWQVANPPEALWPVLGPRLEAAGFVHHSSSMKMEWEGDTVAVVDPAPARLERYAGGDTEIDCAIVDLHNRAYRAARLVPPSDPEILWKSWPGLAAHEYVLARDGDRIVGYAEWFVADGKAEINSLVVDGSHWGTVIGPAVGSKAVEIMIGLGHRKLGSSVTSTNAPSMRLHLKHGWRVAAEQARTYVRRL